MQEILVSELKPHPKNDYFFDDMSGDKWDEFVESVRTSGVIEPIVITQDKVIVSGHQRVRACKELGITSVNAEVRIYDNEDAIIKDLLETNVRQRGDIGGSTVKLGRRIKELEWIYGVRNGAAGETRSSNGTWGKTEMTEVELASKLGIDINTLKRAKLLVSLPQEIQDLVEAGNISASTASRLIARLSPEEQEQLAASLPATEKLTQKQVQEYIDALQETQTKLAVSEQEKENLRVELSTQESEYQKQLAAMAGQVKTVTVTEYPDDYDELKQGVERIKTENKVLRSDHDKLTQRNDELTERIKMYENQTGVQDFDTQVKNDAVFFCSRCATFLTDIGGYAYLLDHIDKLPTNERNAYFKSMEAVYGWASNSIEFLNERKMMIGV